MVYLLAGENTYEIEQHLKKIVDQFDEEVEKFDGSELTIDMLPDLFLGQTLFATKRLIIIKNASKNRQVWGVLSEWLTKVGETIVILVEENLDKRTKTYKWLQKNAEVSESRNLNPREAVEWVLRQGNIILKDVTLAKGVAEFLVQYVGVDQWQLLSELEKLRLSGREPSESLIRELIEPTPQATSFELLDAAFAHNHVLLEQHLSVVSRSEDPHMFFGLLSSQIYALALLQSADGRRQNEIAQVAGIHPYVLQKISPLAEQTSREQLSRLINKLANLDTNLKSQAVDPWIQIRSFLLQI